MLRHCIRQMIELVDFFELRAVFLGWKSEKSEKAVLKLFMFLFFFCAFFAEIPHFVVGSHTEESFFFPLYFFRPANQYPIPSFHVCHLGHTFFILTASARGDVLFFFFFFFSELKLKIRAACRFGRCSVTGASFHARQQTNSSHACFWFIFSIPGGQSGYAFVVVFFQSLSPGQCSSFLW
jgi:hypothetical protein